MSTFEYESFSHMTTPSSGRFPVAKVSKPALVRWLEKKTGKYFVLPLEQPASLSPYDSHVHYVLDDMQS